MKLLETPECPEQIVERQRLCRLMPQSGIEAGERVFPVQITLAQKPFFIARVVAKKNI
jgi:hypothetical protein